MVIIMIVVMTRVVAPPAPIGIIRLIKITAVIVVSIKILTANYKVNGCDSVIGDIFLLRRFAHFPHEFIQQLLDYQV